MKKKNTKNLTWQKKKKKHIFRFWKHILRFEISKKEKNREFEKYFEISRFRKIFWDLRFGKIMYRFSDLEKYLVFSITFCLVLLFISITFWCQQLWSDCPCYVLMLCFIVTFSYQQIWDSRRKFKNMNINMRSLSSEFYVKVK